MYSSVSNRTIDVRSHQVTFVGPTMYINPDHDLQDALESTLTIAEGVVLASGSWERLAVDYKPSVATLIGSCTSFAMEAEAYCYAACRQTPTCVAFASAYTGAEKGKCCLYSAYNFAVGMSSTIIAAPGYITAKLVLNDPGVPFAGLQAHDATIHGEVIVYGQKPDEFWASAPSQLALRRTLALQGSTLSLNVTEQMVNITRKVAPGRRSLLGDTTVEYRVAITPTQYRNGFATGVAAALSSTSASDASTAAFSALFRQQLNLLTSPAADNSFFSLSATTAHIVEGTSSFSFLVSDTTPPSITSFQPLHEANNQRPWVTVTITFDENIQAGTGNIVFTTDRNCDENSDRVCSGEKTVVQRVPVSHENVKFSGAIMTIQPPFWLEAGQVVVSMASGVVLDDPHLGTANPNPAGALIPGVYRFNVTTNKPPGPNTEAPYIQIGSFGKTNDCYYIMSSYECEGFEECSLFVKPMGKCGPGPYTLQERSVTFRAQQHIARVGFKRNGGDGSDQTILTYGGGVPWPEQGIADVREHSEL